VVDAPPPDHVAEDRLVLKLNINPFNSVQTTSVTRLQSSVGLLAQIASTTMALLGGVAFSFAQYEKYCGKKPGEGTGGKDQDEEDPTIEMATMGPQTLSLAELQAGLQQVREMLAQTASPVEVKNTVRDMMADCEKPQEPPPATPAPQPRHTQLDKPEEAIEGTSLYYNSYWPTMGESSATGQKTHLVQV